MACGQPPTIIEVSSPDDAGFKHPSAGIGAAVPLTLVLIEVAGRWVLSRRGRHRRSAIQLCARGRVGPSSSPAGVALRSALQSASTAWTTTCESPDGTVRSGRQVAVGGGQRVTLDLRKVLAPRLSAD